MPLKQNPETIAFLRQQLKADFTPKQMDTALELIAAITEGTLRSFVEVFNFPESDIDNLAFKGGTPEYAAAFKHGAKWCHGQFNTLITKTMTEMGIEPIK